MKVPAFVGLFLMAIGAALMYIGLQDWYPQGPLMFATIPTVPSQNGTGPGSGENIVQP